MSISETTLALAAKAAGWLIDVLSRSPLLKRDPPVRELKYRSHDRRSHKDRRKSPPDQRLRTGIWLQFHRVTRSGEFDVLALNDHIYRKVHDAIWPEIVKYEYRNPRDSAPVPAQMALDAAMDSVWKHKSALPSRGKQQQAVFVLEAIAVELARRFAIVTIDKRQSDRRFHEIHHG